MTFEMLVKVEYLFGIRIVKVITHSEHNMLLVLELLQLSSRHVQELFNLILYKYIIVFLFQFNLSLLCFLTPIWLTSFLKSDPKRYFFLKVPPFSDFVHQLELAIYLSSKSDQSCTRPAHCSAWGRHP